MLYWTYGCSSENRPQNSVIHFNLLFCHGGGHFCHRATKGSEFSVSRSNPLRIAAHVSPSDGAVVSGFRRIHAAIFLRYPSIESCQISEKLTSGAAGLAILSTWGAQWPFLTSGCSITTGSYLYRVWRRRLLPLSTPGCWNHVLSQAIYMWLCQISLQLVPQGSISSAKLISAMVNSPSTANRGDLIKFGSIIIRANSWFAFVWGAL